MVRNAGVTDDAGSENNQAHTSTYIHTYLPACLPAYQPSIHTYLHTYIHTYTDKLRYTHYICMQEHTHIYFRLTGKRYHSHMAGVYCIVICKNAAGRAFSFSCSFSSLLCLFLLLFLPLFLLCLFLLLLLLLFCSLPPMLVFAPFPFSPSPSTLLSLASCASSLSSSLCGNP